MKLKNLQYAVINIRSGNAVAVFMLATDAQKFMDSLHTRVGVHGDAYEITVLGHGIMSI